MGSIRVCGLLLGLVVGSTAQASQPLTYREALVAAMEANPEVSTAILRSEQADWDVKASWGQFEPTYTLGANYNRDQSIGFFQGFPFESRINSWSLDQGLGATTPFGATVSLSNNYRRDESTFVTDFGDAQQEQVQNAHRTSIGFNITQNLMQGVRWSYNIQNVTRARTARTRAELDAERIRQDILSRTATAYWAWAYQERLVEIAEESVSVAAEALRVGAERVSSGEAAPVEETRLEAALVQAKVSAIDARNQADQAEEQLLLLLGRPFGDTWTPASVPGDVASHDLEPAKAVDVALAQNLDLALARSDVEAAEIDWIASRHEVLPTLSAGVGAGLLGQDENFGGALSTMFSGDFPNVSVSVNFEAPLGNRAARGASKRSRLALDAARAQVTSLSATVEANVRQQLRLLASARQQVELADVNLRLQQETLDAEEALHDAGRSILKDVLESRNEVDRLKAEAVKARTDYRTARVELLRLQGLLDPDVH